MCAHVQCGWDVLVICTNHYLTETRWELGREGGGAVWGKLGGARESCGGGGGSCVWELFPSIVGKVMRGRCACGRSVGGELCWRSCGGSYVSFMSLIHSQKCSICYSVACFSECVAEVVFVVQSRSNTLSVVAFTPHKRYSVCTCTVCGT